MMDKEIGKILVALIEDIKRDPDENKKAVILIMAINDIEKLQDGTRPPSRCKDCKFFDPANAFGKDIPGVGLCNNYNMRTYINTIGGIPMVSTSIPEKGIGIYAFPNSYERNYQKAWLQVRENFGCVNFET